LFTVELAGEGTAEMQLDEEGLDLLVDRLLKLLSHRGPGHDHLMSPSWAGTLVLPPQSQPSAHRRLSLRGPGSRSKMAGRENVKPASPLH